MTIEEVLAEIKERRLRVVQRHGQVMLRGDRVQVTPTLLAVLRWHKDEIARHAVVQGREKVWDLEDGSRVHGYEGDPDPASAWCWRYADDDIWHLLR